MPIQPLAIQSDKWLNMNNETNNNPSTAVSSPEYIQITHNERPRQNEQPRSWCQYNHAALWFNEPWNSHYRTFNVGTRNSRMVSHITWNLISPEQTQPISSRFKLLSSLVNQIIRNYRTPVRQVVKSAFLVRGSLFDYYLKIAPGNYFQRHRPFPCLVH